MYTKHSLRLGYLGISGATALSRPETAQTQRVFRVHSKWHQTNANGWLHSSIRHRACTAVACMVSFLFVLVRSTIGDTDFGILLKVHAAEGISMFFLKKLILPQSQGLPRPTTANHCHYPPPLALNQSQSASKNLSNFEIDFLSIFIDFGAQNGGQHPSKIMKKWPPNPFRVPTPFFNDFSTKKERPGPSKT